MAIINENLSVAKYNDIFKETSSNVRQYIQEWAHKKKIL